MTALGVGRDAAQAIVRWVQVHDAAASAHEVAREAVEYVLAHYEGVRGPVRVVFVKEEER